MRLHYLYFLIWLMQQKQRSKKSYVDRNASCIGLHFCLCIICGKIGRKRCQMEKQEYALLQAKCENCSGLCCVALYFSKMDGFPQDKRAGLACRHLRQDFQCDIHDVLAKHKLKGCLAYDCFGAGQYVTQQYFKQKTWHDETYAEQIFYVFSLIFQLHQIRFYLIEALRFVFEESEEKSIRLCLCENKKLCQLDASLLTQAKVDQHREQVNILLKQCIAHLHLAKRKDCIAKPFKNKDMSNYDFSGQLLIGSDFNSAKLEGSVFLGADTRDVDFSNVDLRKVYFLSQGQVNSAKGNRNTLLASHLCYPSSWR